MLCCVLALALGALLQREVDRHAVRGSMPGILRELGAIGEVQVLYPAQREGGEPTVQTNLSEMTD